MSAVVLVNQLSPQWPVVEEELSEAILVTLDVEGRSKEEIEVGIVLTDDQESRQLNLKHRGLDRPANVLSFAMEDGEGFPTVGGGPVLLGDVVIPFETTQAEAKDLGLTLEARLIHLAVHGVLHLLGYDHERSPEEANRQEQREIAILTRLGIADPYV